MIIRKKLILVVIAILVLAFDGFALGAVSSEEAAQLGTILTRFGAEKAGNADGTIPPYTGGITKPPASFKPGSGLHPNPFADEKPLFSITAENMSQYSDKLTEGTKALFKRYPDYRIDVYKTHRSMAYPEFVLKNTAKCAVEASTFNEGLSLRDAHACIPFPIPKTGYEAMWNHLTHWEGRATRDRMNNYLVDRSGRVIHAGGGNLVQEFPYWEIKDLNRDDVKNGEYRKYMWIPTYPPRQAGELLRTIDPVDFINRGRLVYQYLPGQRRVKLAPEIAFDTPIAATGGFATFDDDQLFNGSMERYDFKIIGKKEIYIPYNAYDLAFYIGQNVDNVFGPKHLNPNIVRWELHRVWVVEGKLKPKKRHIYAVRRFYIDEDSWGISASDAYDARGNMFKVGFTYQSPNYEILASDSQFYGLYDMISGGYSLGEWKGMGGFRLDIQPMPQRYWTAEAMAGGGIR